MKKVNVNDLPEDAWASPKGTFAGFGKQVSQALGRDRNSTDLLKRHPFDLEILRVPPGKKPYPNHAHSAQWEFYLVISGSGVSRDDEGTTRISSGDAFLYRPGEAHQFTNDGDVDLVMYVIADNPFGDTCYYPDSNKWSHAIPERGLVRSEALEYYDGEE
jgi:uncharacterized cupin superfamily protein